MDFTVVVWQLIAGGCALVAIVFTVYGVIMQRNRSLLRLENERLSQMAYTDQLTGLGNRHFFEVEAQCLMKLLPISSMVVNATVRYNNRRTSIPAVSAILVDVDHFKRINDQYGHLVGDKILCTIAKKLRQMLRDSDLICRWGGEEILILLPDEVIDALGVAEKVRSAIATIDFGIAGLERVTVSVGVCTAVYQVPLEQLVCRADNALYIAKNSGRNNVAHVALNA